MWQVYRFTILPAVFVFVFVFMFFFNFGRGEVNCKICFSVGDTTKEYV